MGKLFKYAKTSDLMNIKVEYGGKAYKFNLFEETQIDENNINWDLKKHTPSYAFIGMLHAKCKKQLKQLEAHKKTVFNKKYSQYKQEINEATKRQYSNDYAKIKAEKSRQYLDAEKQIQEVEYNLNILEIALNSLSTRKDLLQSLSANIRREH